MTRPTQTVVCGVTKYEDLENTTGETDLLGRGLDGSLEKK